MQDHTPIRLMLITGSPEVAVEAEAAGVDRILVDLEVLGKKERQGHHDTWISGHALEDVGRVRQVLKKAELIVRVNPINEGSEEEVSAVLAQGARTLMLPMFRTIEELNAICEMVGDRAAIMPLVETPEAADRIGEVAKTPGVTEVYLGLNDLHLALEMDFMFEPLANGMVDRMADEIRRTEKPFGFGGIARVGEGQLPGELVLAEHVVAGSQRIRSRPWLTRCSTRTNSGAWRG